MEIHLKKNQATEIMIPMVDSVTPAIFKSGLSVLDTAYYKDGAGAWTTLPIIGIFTEIATTGEYTIKLTAGELNHDLIMIKCTAAGAADSAIIIRTFAVDIDNLVRSTTPANSLDIEAGGTVGLDFANTNGTHPIVPTVTNITNDVGITQGGADKVWGSTARTLTSLGVSLVAEIWNALTSGMTQVGSIGKKLADEDLQKRIVGLLGHNMVIDDPVYVGSKMVSHTVYLYGSKASAQAHVPGGGAGLLYKYAGVASLSAGNTVLIEKVKEL